MIARARFAALIVITVLVTAATLISFAESYRGLFLWAHEHGVPGVWGRSPGRPSWTCSSRSVSWRC
jgi:hypothetical protein